MPKSCNASIQSDICLFDNVLNLSSKDNFCKRVRHAGMCKVTSPFMWSCGFSCTAVSSMNQNNKKARGAVGGNGSGNATADTWAGCLQYLRQYHPAVAIFEKVENLDADATDDDLQSYRSNLELFMASLKEAENACVYKLLNAADFMLPQHRKRFYIVAVDSSCKLLRGPPAQEQVENIMNFVGSLNVGTEDPSLYLLPNSDPIVNNELQRLTEVAIQERVKNANKMKVESWPPLHEYHFKTKWLRWGSVLPPTKIKDNPWFAVLPQRERDCLLMSLMEPNIFATDLSRTIGRNRHAKDRIFATVTPHQKVWCMPIERLVSGPEMMSLQGIPWEDQQDTISYPNNLLASLAGNAFASTSVMAVILSIFLNLEIEGCQK